jgi:hypothetical protein
VECVRATIRWKDETLGVVDCELTPSSDHHQQVLEAKLSEFRLETTVQQTTAGFEEDADSEYMRKLESLSLLVRCDDRLVRAPPPPLRSVSLDITLTTQPISLSAVSRPVRL